MNTRFAVVGAGVAGLAAARRLRERGAGVAVFDKGRSAGGRVATRRGSRQFDHGAQFFTVRDPAFANAIRPLVAAGHVERWHGPFRRLANGGLHADPNPAAERFVGVPGMSALPRALQQGLSVAVGQRVDALRRDDRGWHLTVTEVATGAPARHGPFEAVVLALPPAQAATLLASAAVAGPVPDAAQRLASTLRPCLAAMVAFDTLVPAAEGGLFVTDDVLAWAAHDGGKPGRGGVPTYVLHGTAEWSLARFAADPLANAEALLAALARVLGTALPATVRLEGHRWRYALAGGDTGMGPCVVDAAAGLALVGDGVAGGRVEGAWCSGHAAAQQLLAARPGTRAG